MRKKYIILPFVISFFFLISVGAQDTIPPTIHINPPNPLNLYVGTPYNEYGATAYDNLDGDITHKVDTVGYVNQNTNDSVNVNVGGEYRVHYLVQDAAGYTTDSVRIVNVFDDPDTIPPVITLVGPNPYVLNVNDNYYELGATAIDNKDGDITDSIKINSDSVNTSIEGEYRVHYTVSDSENNTTHEIRRVIVVSTGVQEEKPSNLVKTINFIVSYNHGNISIHYTIPFSSSVKLEAYDIKGKLVKVITDKFMQKGSYSVNWDSKRFCSGVYFLKLTINGSAVSKKFTIIE